ERRVPARAGLGPGRGAGERGRGEGLMPARKAVVTRKTRETDIELSLALEGAGRSKIATGIGFLDHMLTSFATHGRFDLVVKCKGDLHVDAHHSVEDVGIAFGQALK